LAAAPRPAGRLRPKPPPRRPGAPHPLLSSPLAEPVDPRVPRSGASLRRGPSRQLDLREGNDHEDLLAVGAHLDRPPAPLFGQARLEPAADLLEHCDYNIT